MKGKILSPLGIVKEGVCVYVCVCVCVCAGWNEHIKMGEED